MKRDRVIYAAMAGVLSVGLFLLIRFGPDYRNIFEKLTTPKEVLVAKQARTLKNTNSNEAVILKELSETDGVLAIKGWASKKVSDKVYLVTFEVTENNLPRGYAFEVNLINNIVRNVFESESLCQHYGFPVVDSNKPVEIISKILEKHPGETRSHDDLILTFGEWATKNRQDDIFRANADFFIRYVVIHDEIDRAQKRRFGYRFRMPTVEEFLADANATN